MNLASLAPCVIANGAAGGAAGLDQNGGTRTADAGKKANAHVGIAVVGANGDLVLSIRLEGTPDEAVTSSQGKARAALLFGMSTKQLQDAMAAGKTVEARLTAPVNGAAELTLMQDGLPIIREGKVISGIGVGGAPSRQELLMRVPMRFRRNRPRNA